ncbi:MAG TPA: hypothetical protein EYH01_03925 [Campylobacterales bacterium]|nr:hypothetical protein [Campylobacterales bacterium]
MKYLFITIFVLFSTLEANAIHSTVKIPYSECSKYPYAHVIGGTMHSRFVQKKRLEKKAKSLASHTANKTLTILQKEHPEFSLESINIAVKSCNVYYKALSQNSIYYFDAGNLALLQTKER